MVHLKIVRISAAATDRHRRAFSTRRNLMLDRPWHLVVLVVCLLGGCNANYVFDDAQYRPLGEPQAVIRGR
ncbi:hypothetical protein SAMN04490197_0487 [Pseudomonas orientalis]|uniref:Type VI secretion protein n=1 Tax=Pseudomonas orientalis TaxID=76758 RepID=A0A8B3XUI0_9PSED|nr:hypothetical protein SAMN04490197_0487 [Pseudomonas orientalis]